LLGLSVYFNILSIYYWNEPADSTSYLEYERERQWQRRLNWMIVIGEGAQAIIITTTIALLFTQ
jgi:hypothetical protein